MKWLVAVIAAALLLPTAAVAHLEVEPGLLESGRDMELRVELPDLRPGDPPTSLAVSGDGIRLLGSDADGTFGRETRWRVRVHVVAEPGPTELLLRAGFADGSTVEVRRVVTVVPPHGEDGLPLAVAAFAALGLAGLVGAALLLRRR